MSTFIKSLEDLWSKGQLRDVEQDLDCFIRQNLPDLRKAVTEGRVAGHTIARRRYARPTLVDNQKRRVARPTRTNGSDGERAAQLAE